MNGTNGPAALADGLVNGAIESGQRAAAEVLAEL